MAQGNKSGKAALAQDNDAIIAKERIAGRKGKVEKELLFSKINYMIIGLGLMMVIIGFFLMSGGHNESEEWNADVIYSFVRITISPLVILSGLGVVIFAIFKSSEEEGQNLKA